jgi:hypothetical protein
MILTTSHHLGIAFNQNQTLHRLHVLPTTIDLATGLLLRSQVDPIG